MLEQRLIALIDSGREALTAEVVRRIAGEVPSLVETEERATLAEASTNALISEFAGWVRSGTVAADTTAPRAPAAALAFARRLAREAVPLAELLRAYRLGQELIFVNTAQLADADVAGLSRVGMLTFRYVDGVTGEVVDTFERERETFLRGALARRDRVVADLLAGAPVDLASAERTLGRRLAGPHLALVAWHDGGAGDDAERTADGVRRVLEAAGSGRPLLLSGPAGEAFAWTTPAETPSALSATVTDELRRTGTRVAIGLPAAGAHGFAASRRQADAARRVAHLVPGHPIVGYGDVALLSVLFRDQATAAAFAREQLGQLFGDAPKVRETLATYLEKGRDASAAAAALGVHRNTVMRRLARARELLGRPIEAAPNELSAALTIAQALRHGGA